jgi:hypothetical protein
MRSLFLLFLVLPVLVSAAVDPCKAITDVATCYKNPNCYSLRSTVNGNSCHSCINVDGFKYFDSGRLFTVGNNDFADLSYSYKLTCGGVYIEFAPTFTADTCTATGGVACGLAAGSVITSTAASIITTSSTGTVIPSSTNSTSSSSDAIVAGLSLTIIIIIASVAVALILFACVLCCCCSSSSKVAPRSNRTRV